MPTCDRTLTIPEIGAFLAVRSGLDIPTAAAENGLTVREVRTVLHRIRRIPATPKGRTRR